MKKTKIKGKATYGTVMGAKIRKAMNGVSDEERSRLTEEAFQMAYGGNNKTTVQAGEH